MSFLTWWTEYEQNIDSTVRQQAGRLLRKVAYAAYVEGSKRNATQPVAPGDSHDGDTGVDDLGSHNEGYGPLRRVLDDAYTQASSGKGKERHANGKRFVDQPLFDVMNSHGVGFATGQAAKKASESLGMEKEAAYHELLGAIVYLSAAALKRKEID